MSIYIQIETEHLRRANMVSYIFYQNRMWKSVNRSDISDLNKVVEV